MKNKGLIKRTKKELIEIIIRKDDIEKRLREQISELMDNNAELKNQLLNKNIITDNVENG